MPVSVPVGGGPVEHVEVRHGEYHDSVTLMLAGRAVGGVGGVERVLVAMATELNVALLGELGYAALEDAGPADLVVAFACDSADAKAAALDALAGSLTPSGGSITAPGHAQADQLSPRTTATALGRTGAPVTLISTPGLASVAEAMESLEYGASPIIFSDNVPIDCEVRLKEEARRRGLLVMGPDCGTVVLHGTGLAFANVTRPGPISLVAASGTGAQELMALLDAAGTGIRHCLGVGGRDLSRQVAGRSTLAALTELADDGETELIVVVSKPPHPDVAARIEAHAATLGKPVHFAFVSDGHPTLTEAAMRILSAVGRRAPVPWPHWASAATAGMTPSTGTTVRGLFSGGTLCAEAAIVLKRAAGRFTFDLTDFGDDAYTRGRPHPMIDNTLRLRAVAEAAADGEVGVLLLDVVLGRGAHADPAAEVAAAVTAARKERPDLAVVVSLCGTAGDPQGLARQAETLAGAGAWVFLSNAEAAQTAARLAVGH
jgi:FdrA protein